MAVMNVSQALKNAIELEMRRDPRVYCIGEDEDIPNGMGGVFLVTKGLGDEFGANVRVAHQQGFEMKGQNIADDRVINTPISEILLGGVRVGSAMAGLRPVADLQYGDFLFCMMDQLVNQAAKMRYIHLRRLVQLAIPLCMLLNKWKKKNHMRLWVYLISPREVPP